MKKDIKMRFDRIRLNNTYFYHDDDFENKSEAYIKMMTDLLLQLKEEIDKKGLTEETISDWFKRDKNGLTAILTLIGLSHETFLRLISFIRIINDEDLNNLVNRKDWPDKEEIYLRQQILEMWC